MVESAPIQLSNHGETWMGCFTAMACPCEVLIETNDQDLARQITHTVWQEAKRIEEKFSRYRRGNIIDQINNANGQPVEVDSETTLLLDFATQCYQLSEKKFDITSGVLRRIWKFNDAGSIPTQAQIDAILPLIGWHQVSWQTPYLTLEPNMEIDFGGIAKEYAVDQACSLASTIANVSILVNFGGDIYANKTRSNHQPWQVGVDDPHHTGQIVPGNIKLFQGGLTTSGDARRYLMQAGVRYGHILNPLTGWPITGAPHSVTVIANTCLEAGMLSTFAMLHGMDAEKFLDAQQLKYWCIR